jgi:hypothetical protein
MGTKRLTPTHSNRLHVPMNGSANNNSVTSSRTPSQQGACSYAEAQNGSRIKKSAPRSNNPVQPDKISSDGITERAAEEGIASPKKQSVRSSRKSAPWSEFAYVEAAIVIQNTKSAWRSQNPVRRVPNRLDEA